jgi:hypothetical protein
MEKGDVKYPDCDELKRCEEKSMILYTHGKHKIAFQINEDDYDLISRYSWTACKATNGFYIQASASGCRPKMIRLHRLLMSPASGLDVDHIDGDPTNNKRENLRVCTHKENISNKRKSKSNKSGYKGVCWSARYKCWRAYIGANGKTKYLGRFDTAQEAYHAYCDAANKSYGEFARNV